MGFAAALHVMFSRSKNTEGADIREEWRFSGKRGNKIASSSHTICQGPRQSRCTVKGIACVYFLWGYLVRVIVAEIYVCLA